MQRRKWFNLVRELRCLLFGQGGRQNDTPPSDCRGLGVAWQPRPKHRARLTDLYMFTLGREHHVYRASLLDFASPFILTSF